MLMLALLLFAFTVRLLPAPAAVAVLPPLLEHPQDNTV
jgi:hypothetical protein